MMLRLLLLALLCIPLAAHAFELQKIPAGGVLHGKFTEDRLIPGFKAPLHSTGRFTVSDKGIVWEVEKPFASKIVITPDGLTQEINGEQTMNLSAARVPFFAHLHVIITGMIAGDWNTLANDFDVKRKGDENHWQVELIPHHADNPALPLKAIKIDGTKFVDHVVMTRRDDSSDTLVFFDQKITAQSAEK